MAKAMLMHRRRQFLRDGVFIEMILWRVPVSVRGSVHDVKYSMALVAGGECVLRYDNEAGKGDHRHRGKVEMPYVFKDVEMLMADFMTDVKEWLDDHP